MKESRTDNVFLSLNVLINVLLSYFSRLIYDCIQGKYMNRISCSPLSLLLNHLVSTQIIKITFIPSLEINVIASSIRDTVPLWSILFKNSI